MEKLNYKFTPIPSYFHAILDGECLKMMSELIFITRKLQKVAKDGWLQLPNVRLEKVFWNRNELQKGESTRTSRRKLEKVRATLTSYGFIEFKSGHVDQAPKYKINFKRIGDLNAIPFEEWVESGFRIYSGDSIVTNPFPFDIKEEKTKQKVEQIEEKVEEKVTVFDVKDLPF